MRQPNKIKYFLLLVMSTLFFSNGFSQAAAPAPAAAANSFAVPINTVLCVIAVVLLIIILVLATTINSAVDLYKINKAKSGNGIKAGILLGFLFLSQFAFSQDAAAAAAQATSNSADIVARWYFYGFVVIIIVEIAIILFFIRALRFLTGIDQLKKEKAARGEEKTLWETINQFKPLEEEDNMDTGHNYDGIRELDNITPPWFVAGFAATIVFAAIYLYRYHVAESAPMQYEEYAIEMKQAQVLQDSLLKLQGNNIDENTVALLGADDVAAGNKVYSANCAACHGDKGQGGVGPNLTDEFWIHGGSVKDVFKTIKYGYVDKGMKSWKDDFSPKQIAQLASFVKSLKGTNPPGAKEKQGELYVEEAAPATAMAADSAKTK